MLIELHSHPFSPDDVTLVSMCQKAVARNSMTGL